MRRRLFEFEARLERFEKKEEEMEFSNEIEGELVMMNIRYTHEGNEHNSFRFSKPDSEVEIFKYGKGELIMKRLLC
jgi:hypothetical protein